MKPKNLNSTSPIDVETCDEKVTTPERQSHTAVPSSAIKIYHERQSKQLCALHALNNLFQSSQAFTKNDLDNICRDLAPNSRIINPHKSMFGLGCYDVNVIIAALAKKQYEVVWFDKRKHLSTLNFDNIFGLILNVPDTHSNAIFAIPLSYIPPQAQIWSSQKHWVAIRKIGSYYYNLDSKLEAPMFIGCKDDLLKFLQYKIPMEKAEILLVVDKTVSENQSWQKINDSANNQSKQ